MNPMPSRGSEIAAPLARRTTPVFVDRTGRRIRRVRAAAIAGVTTVGLSLGLVVASMLGVPTVVSPLLPPPASPAPASEAPSSAQSGTTPAPPAPAATEGTDGARDAGTDEATAPATMVAPAPAPTIAPTTAATPATAQGNAPPAEERGSSTDAPGHTRTAPTTPAEPAKP